MALWRLDALGGVERHTLLGSQVPFVLLTVSGPFEFTDSEAANLGAYLTSGGFLFAEIVRELRPDYSDADLDIPAVRSLIRTSLQAAGYQERKDWCIIWASISWCML